MRIASEIILTAQERAELMKLARSRLTSVRLAQRAGIVLLAAQPMDSRTRTSPTCWALDVSKLPAGDNATLSPDWLASSETCHEAHHPWRSMWHAWWS